MLKLTFCGRAWILSVFVCVCVRVCAWPWILLFSSCVLCLYRDNQSQISNSVSCLCRVKSFSLGLEVPQRMTPDLKELSDSTNACWPLRGWEGPVGYAGTEPPVSRPGRAQHRAGSPEFVRREGAGR